MKGSILVIIGAGFITSCHKDQSVPANSWDWFGTHDASVYNYVLISGNQIADQSDSENFQISVNAAFIDSNSRRLSGIKELTINSRPINRNVDSTYSFAYNNTPYFQEGLSLFGSQINIKIQGNSGEDNITQTIYLPRKIVRLIADFPDDAEVSRDMHLSWDTDPDNHWGKVIIQVYYNATMSHFNDSSLPAKIEPLNYTVQDQGNFVIPATDLKKFPLKAYIGISIARGEQAVAVLPKSLRRVYYFASSSASTIPLLVSNPQ